MRNEIKLSLKGAQERSLCGQLDYERSCDDEQREEPVHKPGWHRAPTVADVIAAHKSRPVDPPRKRDMSEGSPLWNAALRPPAAWCDWNGPSSDPCLKYAGIGGGGHASPPALGSGNLPDAAPAPAPVADSAVGEFEPVGTIGREGDTVVWPWHVYDGWRREPHALKIARNGDHTFYDGYMADVFSIADGDALALRILKRKNIAARAWKENGGYQWLCIGKRWYSLSPYSGWSDYGDNFLWGNPMTGWSELTDPAEIQRLVAELHAAGLGK